jgi:hypothetical protein
LLSLDFAGQRWQAQQPSAMAKTGVADINKVARHAQLLAQQNLHHQERWLPKYEESWLPAAAPQPIELVSRCDSGLPERT